MLIPCEACYSTFILEERFVKKNGSLVRCSKCQKVFKVYPPKDIDPRNCPRVKTRNLISFSVFNKSGKVISHGVGVAMDISEGGISLETPNSIDSALVHSIHLSAIDYEKNLIEVKGKLIRTQQTSTGMNLHGIKFVDGDKRVAKFIATVIKEYNFRGEHLTLMVKQRAIS